MFERLAEELTGVFARGVEAPLDDDEFDGLARRVFEFQFEHNAVYRGFALARGRTPETVAGWRDVPPVPASAFKHLALVSGSEADVERVFRTSGTTGGRGRRGEHHVRSLALYRASLLPPFRANVLSDGARLPFLSLVPSPEARPDSSLSTMVGIAAEELGAPGGGWFVDPARGLDAADLDARLERAASRGEPVLLVGTAFAFVHWLDESVRSGRRHRLADGSRVLETGGFKGRSRVLAREELYAGLSERLGIHPGRILNEYGMTELLSQYYEPVLRETRARGSSAGAGTLDARRHVPPPWMRARILDPVTLEPLPDGERGLLCHHDLANLGSVASVLTADVGVWAEGGLRVFGRAEGAEPRGCSVAMDELLAAAAEEA